MSKDGIEKSALLLLSLGEEVASEIFKLMGAKEVQQLGQKMATVSVLEKQKLMPILDEVRSQFSSSEAIGINQNEYVQSVLKKALGDDRANYLINRIVSGGDTSGLDSLKWMDPKSISELIKNEHPQIAAALLCHLEPEQAAQVLNYTVERHRHEIMLRLATLDAIQPEALDDLNEALQKIVASSANTKSEAMGGVKALANILNFVGAAQEANAIKILKDFDEKLAQRVEDEMFTFENLVDLDPKAIQTLLREVSNDLLVIALKMVKTELKEKILKNMSQRASEALKEDLESRGPMKLSDVESAQKEILKIARRLMDEGQITLGGVGGEVMV